MTSDSKKLWGGRFSGPTAPAVEEFTESISFDYRLFREDISGSIAHAEMLLECGLITESDFIEIRSTLKEIEEEIESGRFEFDKKHEDIHMNIEAALIDRIGEPGLKLHTARSRNDQVACDLKLWTRGAIDSVLGLLESCQKALLERAQAFADIIVPGCTHLQHAQPILFSHALLAYVEMFERDRGRLRDCRKRLNTSPLGACALAGSSLPADPVFTARKLGFDSALRNSLDAVGDRDFAVEFVFSLSMIAMHMSRLAEEWLIWASQDQDFLDLDESFCTGSSIMPQKKNPDVLELIKGKTGQVYGDLTCLLTILKGLPLSYNRDLQEDKKPLFEAKDEVCKSLSVLALLISRANVKKNRLASACEKGHMDATALADYLVKRGLPFRESHRIVGDVVRYAVSCDKKLSELSVDEMRGFSELICEDVFGVLGARNCIENYRTVGSSSPGEVQRQIEHWKRVFDVEGFGEDGRSKV